jgi:hypothetical protein
MSIMEANPAIIETCIIEEVMQGAGATALEGVIAQPASVDIPHTHVEKDRNDPHGEYGQLLDDAKGDIITASRQLMDRFIARGQ